MYIVYVYYLQVTGYRYSHMGTIIYHVGNCCGLRYALKPIVDWTSCIHTYIFYRLNE